MLPPRLNSFRKLREQQQKIIVRQKENSIYKSAPSKCASLLSRRVSVPVVHQYSTMATPGTPPRTTRWSPATPPVTPATPPRSPAIVKGGELSEESRMEIALPIAVIMYPGETRLWSGVSSAITTEYGVGERHISQLWQNIAQQLMDG